MKFVEVREGNTEFNECHFEILLLGKVVDSYSGSRRGAEDWCGRRVQEVERDALVALEQLGYRRPG